MKRSCLALAVLATLVTGARAQLPLYGAPGGGVIAEWDCRIACGASRFGAGLASGSTQDVRGRVSLGGGLDALLVLDSGMFNDAGAPDPYGRWFGRRAYVGLAGRQGALTLGRQYDLQYDTLVDVADPFRGGMAGSAANLVGYAVQHYENAVKFTTAARHGVSAGAIYSLGEAPHSSAANRAYGLTVGYAEGAVKLSLSHQRKNTPLDAAGNTPAVDVSARNTLLAANLAAGPMVFYLAYGHNRGEGGAPWDGGNPYGALALNTPSNNSRDKLVGLALPAGPYTFLASYIRKEDRTPLRRDASQAAVGMAYSWSRRTDLYASYARIHNSNGANYTVGGASAAGHGDRALTFGLRRAF